MNFFAFLSILSVWLVGAHTDSMMLSFFATLAILQVASDMQEEQNRHEEKMDSLDDFDPLFPNKNELVTTSGPVFPELASRKHLHFLEEPDNVGVFSYNTSTHEWEPVGQLPYPAGYKPEQVASIVQ